MISYRICRSAKPIDGQVHTNSSAVQKGHWVSSCRMCVAAPWASELFFLGVFMHGAMSQHPKEEAQCFCDWAGTTGHSGDQSQLRRGQHLGRCQEKADRLIPQRSPSTTPDSSMSTRISAWYYFILEQFEPLSHFWSISNAWFVTWNGLYFISSLHN